MGFIFPHKAKVIQVKAINHDVILLQISKPFKFQFDVGQAVELSIDKPGYETAVAPFTIANLPSDTHLEFIIKKTPNTKGLTHGLAQLVPKDIVQLTDAWHSYKYHGNGTFIAAGTGITPFLPIFKKIQENGIDLKQNHKLIYANKTKDDILFYNNLKQLFSNKLALILSRVKSKNLHFGKIDHSFLSRVIQNTEQKFYVCGPREFEADVKTHLISIGVQHDLIQTGAKF